MLIRLMFVGMFSPIGGTFETQHGLLNANVLPYTLNSSLLDMDTTNTTDTANGTTEYNDMNSAFYMMRYHRSMINEYLCHNFVAKEILQLFELQGYTATERVGLPAQSNINKLPNLDRNQLLDDVGSDNYKKWLAKSVILNDIYKRFDIQNEAEKPQFFASGDVTGFAVQSEEKVPTDHENHDTESKQYTIPFKPIRQHTNIILNSPNSHEADIYKSQETYGVTDHGVNAAVDHNTEYGYAQNMAFDVGDHDNSFAHHPKLHPHVEVEKGLALKDLFNLALTALAFLAFGMFILNLIMACYVGPSTTLVMQMTTESAANDNSGNKRVKRNVLQMKQEKLNQLTFHVINSIDALTSLHEHNVTEEQCLKRSLCESNTFARSLPLHQQIWIPIWSFGISWISGKYKQKLRLENLQASLLGLGKTDCRALYINCERKSDNKKKRKEDG